VVLNNLAYTEFRAGDAEAAVQVAERLHSVVIAAGFELGYEELDTIASAYRIGGRLEEAERLLLPVLDGRGGDLAASDFDGGASCLLTLAQVQRSLGSLDAAQQTLEKCRALCEGQPTSVRILAQREHAELSAARGDYRDAYETFFEFFEEHQRLESAEREARARSLQAIFETTEARRDSERFRELSERDALTGLRNRRFVEAHLDAVLLDVIDGGGPVSVALLDLDRFKRINDTRSHAVGDDVLRRVAHVLAHSAREVPGGVAARIGGEEFLLILPGLDASSALDHLERTRLRIQHRGWSDLTAGLPVTVSVGVACAPQDGTDRGDLLHRTDVRLYAAKAAGRNQVIGVQTP
ncbi:MAG: GGDEF domain-containing protein, partial [Nocardioidaceae bacterium]